MIAHISFSTLFLLCDFQHLFLLLVNDRSGLLLQHLFLHLVNDSSGLLLHTVFVLRYPQGKLLYPLDVRLVACTQLSSCENTLLGVWSATEYSTLSGP